MTDVTKRAKDVGADAHINESILSEEILEDQKKNRIDHMTYLPGMEEISSDVMDQVVSEMKKFDYDRYTAADVKRALAHDVRTPEDFAGIAFSGCHCLFIEEIAQRAAANGDTEAFRKYVCICLHRLYISNYCENYCIYCGFNCHNKIDRAQLDEDGH